MSPEPPSLDSSILLAIILKPFRLDTVLHALKPFHAQEVTISEVRGYGRQKGHVEMYRGAEYLVSFIPKLKVELSVPRSELDDVIQAVEQAARTGRIGDGKIFVQAAEVLEY